MKKWSVVIIMILLVSSSLVGCSKQTPAPVTTSEPSVTVSAAPPKAVTAGKDGQRIAKITIKESTPGSLTPNGTITFTLPADTKFSSDPTLSLVTGTGIWSSTSVKPTNDSREVTYTMSATGSTGTAAELDLANVDIDIAPSVSGDVKMEVTGSAGVVGEFIVANCSKMLSVTSVSTSVKIGLQNQTAGNIIISEGAPEAIASSSGHKQIQLMAPSGVTFSAVPKVDVTAGNLSLGSVSLSSDNRAVLISTASTSTEASTIQVSGIKLTVNRTVPAGDIEVTVGGTAIIQNAPEHFPNATNPGRVVIAKVVTPAP